MSKQPPLERAHELRRAGDLEGAIRVLTRNLGQNLAQPQIACALAAMLAEQGHEQRAGRMFRHALKIARDDLFLKANYGAFLGQSGQHEAAREILQEVVVKLRKEGAADTRVAHAECMLGHVLLELGKVDEARRLARRWLSHPKAWDMASDVFTWTSGDDPEESLLLAEACLERGEFSPRMVVAIVEDALNRRHPVRAVEVIRKAEQLLFPGWAAALEDESPGLLQDVELALRRAILEGTVVDNAPKVLAFLRSLTR